MAYKFAYVIFLLYLCNVKGKNNKIMDAALRQNFQAPQYHSLDEFADKLAKKLGQHYGMNDIRELLK